MESSICTIGALLDVLGDYSRAVLEEHLHNAESRSGLYERLGIGRRDFRELDLKELEELWKGYIGPKYYHNSVLSVDRQWEILRLIGKPLQVYRRRKKEMLEKQKDLWDSRSVSQKRIFLSEPAWSSVNTADSKRGYRLQVGFRNGGCRYWQSSETQIGCYNCGYFAGCIPAQCLHSYANLGEFSNMLVNQFHNALLRQKGYVHPRYDVVDIVSDGSFLNPEEFPTAAQDGIFREIAKMPDIERVLVESRPEYVSHQRVVEILQVLRHDQSLEIAVGLETADDFVRTFCINKGFGLNTTEIEGRRIKGFSEIIAELAELKERCAIQAYVLIKPALLSEAECLVDAVNAGRYLKLLSNTHSFPIKVKYEPTVVSRGTLLEVLYGTWLRDSGTIYHPDFGDGAPPNFNDEKEMCQWKRLHTAPSYWTVVEMLAQLAGDEIAGAVRIGAREDMDDYIALPAVYDATGLLSNIDFILYNAVQDFNSHRNIAQLLGDIELALSHGSFTQWRGEVSLRNPTLVRLAQELTHRVDKLVEREENKKAHELLPRLSAIVSELEYGTESQEFAGHLASKWSDNRKGQYSEDIRRFAHRIARRHIPSVRLKDINVDQPLFVSQFPFDFVRYELNVFIGAMDRSYDLWVYVPTTRIAEREPLLEGIREEIERKFIIDEVPKDLLSKPSRIVQAYVAISDAEEVRVRRRVSSDGREHYTLTCKSVGDKVRKETEASIYQETFRRLLLASNGRIVEKDRYEIPWDDLKIELDMFKKHLSGLVVAEVEFETEHDSRAFSKPTWFGQEVTSDKRFKNESLATLGIDSIVIPTSQAYADTCLVLPSPGQNEEITDRLMMSLGESFQKAGLGLHVLALPQLGEMSGVIRSAVVDAMRSAALVIADISDVDLNLTTKLAIRKAVGTPTVYISQKSTTDFDGQEPFYFPDYFPPSRLAEAIVSYYCSLPPRWSPRAVLCHYPGAPTISDLVRSQLIVDNEILSRIEAKAKEVWVISTTLEFDVGELNVVVTRNLASGKRYSYFLPNLTTKHSFSEKLASNYVQFWRYFEPYRNQITVKHLPKETPFHFQEIVLYDARMDKEPFGFTYIQNERAVGYELIRIPGFLSARVAKYLSRIGNY